MLNGYQEYFYVGIESVCNVLPRDSSCFVANLGTFLLSR